MRKSVETHLKDICVGISGERSRGLSTLLTVFSENHVFSSLGILCWVRSRPDLSAGRECVLQSDLPACGGGGRTVLRLLPALPPQRRQHLGRDNRLVLPVRQRGD